MLTWLFRLLWNGLPIQIRFLLFYNRVDNRVGHLAYCLVGLISDRVGRLPQHRRQGGDRGRSYSWRDWSNRSHRLACDAQEGQKGSAANDGWRCGDR